MLLEVLTIGWCLGRRIKEDFLDIVDGGSMFRNVLNVSPGFLIPDDFNIRHHAVLYGVAL